MAPLTDRFAGAVNVTSNATSDLTQQASTCCVLCLGIVNYEARTVSEQVALKELLTQELTIAIRHVAPNDRIVLDTHDGIAISFLGRTEDAFLSAVVLRDALAQPRAEGIDASVRIGLNCGPVRLVNDPKGRAAIVGDGINVARRVMLFARPGTVLVSKSFFENVAHIAEAHRDVFAYFGARTDNNVRTHELYEITLADTTAATLEKITGISNQHNGADADDKLSSNDERFEGAPPRASQRWFQNAPLAFLALSGAIACLIVALLFALQKHALSTQANQRSYTAWRPDAVPNDKLNRSTASDKVPTAPESAQPQNTGEPNRSDSALAEPARDKTASAAPSPKRNNTVGSSANPLPTSAFRESNIVHGVAVRTEEQSQTSKAQQTPAVVSLAVAPWGEVYVNGRKAGVSPPLDRVEVEPGMVHIEIRNAGAQSYSEVVQLAAGEQTRVKYKFPAP